jgi:AraC-like DNA-binding protein
MVSVNRWRMMLTASALRHGGTWVSEVGFSVGYTSEAAFRKTMGCSPRRQAARSEN